VQTLVKSIETATGESTGILEGGTTSDTGILNKWGRIPTITLGPGGGNAHAQDEYVNVEDLLRLVKIYALQIVNWCGSAQ
jgi:acetylornithine deacetylase